MYGGRWANTPSWRNINIELVNIDRQPFCPNSLIRSPWLYSVNWSLHIFIPKFTRVNKNDICIAKAFPWCSGMVKGAHTDAIGIDSSLDTLENRLVSSLQNHHVLGGV